jgi:3-isopropylmalate dehydrogenase
VDLLPNGGSMRCTTDGARPILGVIEGCGIGPEVVGATLQILAAVGQVLGLRFDLRFGGLVGEEAEARFGTPLPNSTLRFFEQVFDEGGAVLSGPGGGRYVYDLRDRFDLFCKFVPVGSGFPPAPAARRALEGAGRIDILIVRDNIGGVYQGRWHSRRTRAGRVAGHSFSYNEAQVQRLAEVAVRAAASRRGGLHVIVKENGVPAISALWRDVSGKVARKYGVKPAFMNIDFAAYELVRNPSRFDVILTPNLFGDILVDLTGVLLGSRGVTFSGNYDAAGHAVYQTNHGCANDLARADVANPAGQILSLAMLLRESFGLADAAALVESAVVAAWKQGWRTADMAQPGCRVVGTKAMTDQIARHILRSVAVWQPA